MLLKALVHGAASLRMGHCGRGDSQERGQEQDLCSLPGSPRDREAHQEKGDSQVQWPTPAIPVAQNAKVGGSQV